MIKERIVAASQVFRGKKPVATGLVLVSPWGATMVTRADLGGPTSFDFRDRVPLEDRDGVVGFDEDRIRNIVLSVAREQVAPGVVHRFEATLTHPSVDRIGGEGFACYRALSRDEMKVLGPLYLIARSPDGYRVGPIHSQRTSDYPSREVFDWAAPFQTFSALKDAEKEASALAHADAYVKFTMPEVAYGVEGTPAFSAILERVPQWISRLKAGQDEIGSIVEVPDQWDDLEWVDSGIGRLWNDRHQGLVLSPEVNALIPTEHRRETRWYRAADHVAHVVEAIGARFPVTFPAQVRCASRLYLHGLSGPAEVLAPADEGLQL